MSYWALYEGFRALAHLWCVSCAVNVGPTFDSDRLQNPLQSVALDIFPDVFKASADNPKAEELLTMMAETSAPKESLLAINGCLATLSRKVGEGDEDEEEDDYPRQLRCLIECYTIGMSSRLSLAVRF